MHGLRLPLSILVTALLALPSSAGAVTFGANLDQRNANSTATCGYPPYYPGFSPLGNSCTFFSTATPAGQASETQVVPLADPAVNGNQSGTITAVRIKTGPYQAGPAKLTVLRAHRVFNAPSTPAHRLHRLQRLHSLHRRSSLRRSGSQPRGVASSATLPASGSSVRAT
jgi:hypothetical protein